MSELRESKECPVATVHETHSWGEIYGQYWACPGIDEFEDERVRSLERLEKEFEELAARVKKHQILSLKACFKAFYDEGVADGYNDLTRFNEWWTLFTEGETWNDCTE